MPQYGGLNNEFGLGFRVWGSGIVVSHRICPNTHENMSLHPTMIVTRALKFPGLVGAGRGNPKRH